MDIRIHGGSWDSFFSFFLFFCHCLCDIRNVGSCRVCHSISTLNWIVVTANLLCIARGKVGHNGGEPVCDGKCRWRCPLHCRSRFRLRCQWLPMAADGWQWRRVNRIYFVAYFWAPNKNCSLRRTKNASIMLFKLIEFNEIQLYRRTDVSFSFQ